PYPVTTGFTSATALLIFSAQVKDLLGLTTGPLPEGVFAKWQVYAATLPTVNGAAVGLSAGCLAVMVFWPQRFRRVPGVLVAQGFANLASPLFGGIPATGAVARSTTNLRNGATTPVAGVVHALTLVLILAVFGPLASLVPMACLAAVLALVAFNMSEWRTF